MNPALIEVKKPTSKIGKNMMIGQIDPVWKYADICCEKSSHTAEIPITGARNFF